MDNPYVRLSLELNEGRLTNDLDRALDSHGVFDRDPAPAD